MKKAAIMLIIAMAVTAINAEANTITSSTMKFKGTLTANTDGSYTGTIGAAADFDVYADGDTYTNNDAWPSSTWDPDVPDAYDQIGTSFSDDNQNEGEHEHYALNLDGTTWELWYVSPANSFTQAKYDDGTTVYPYAPFGGTVDWTEGFATEAGQNWEQQWSWGYENVALEYPGFDIAVTDLGSDEYEVTMTPAPEPATMVILGLGGLGLLRRKRA
jgi:hypothetical protein